MHQSSPQSTRSQRTFTIDELELSREENDQEVSTTGDEAGDDSGDYSTRLGEILGDEDEDGQDGAANGSDDEGEAFFYAGADASTLRGTYDAQLKDVLGPDDDDQLSPTAEESQGPAPLGGAEDEDEFDYLRYRDEAFSDRSPPSQQGSAQLSPPLRDSSPIPHYPLPKFARPNFLHPTVSRLRSFIPQNHQRLPSSSSVGTLNSNAFAHLNSPEPSHLSAISRVSSTSNLHNVSRGVSTPPTSDEAGPGSQKSPREVFRWTPLRQISSQIYSTNSAKANAVLDIHMGSPTVIAANGLICIGTTTGRAFVYDFRQQLKCVCGSDSSANLAGAVSALSLSLDHTFLAVGHVNGHIYLYDLSHPNTPARTVLPTDLVSVAAGRKEGHLDGSRITHIGFVGARHTALVSTDETGLAFYHSLGKVLFVEASDVLRILGKYPEAVSGPSVNLKKSHLRVSSSVSTHTETNGTITPPQSPARTVFHQRRTGSILAMGPLPIATSAHPTDSYNLIALLTPIKLVIVGLHPSARTWYRRHRGGQDAESVSTMRGCLAWFPSISSQDTAPKNQKPVNGAGSNASKPILAYSWGRTLLLLRVRESKVSVPKSNVPGKTKPAQEGKLVFEEAGEWSAKSDVLAVQWLNINQLVVLTCTSLDVYDVRTLERVESSSIDVHSSFTHGVSTPSRYHLNVSKATDEIASLASSLKVYKGKIFILGHRDIKVGTLLSWADRLLAFVQDGDFLSAIDLARTYYTGEASGNKAGLPEEPEAMRQVVGQRIRDLMLASARYTFSEDRMTDGTHFSPSGRGVDRTSLFERLVSTVARACLALGDLDFLFEDLYELYQSNGISGMFLLQIQPFLLDGDIRVVPPRITQQLVAYHDERGDYAMAERVIWHIDPMCLDINQAIQLCRDHDLYDALIYVYNRALKDYVSPIVELLALVRKVQQKRRERPSRIDDPGSPSQSPLDRLLEALVPNAYKIYPYLGDILSGLTHPSQEPMPDEEAHQAKADIYPFLFFGRSSIWQGQVILTSDEEGGPEPTYPYLRLLIRFDAEALLHALDLAFEDSYLNESDQTVNRQVIVNVLLELLRSSDLSSADLTFLRIFIARNVPKYPQFIHLTPTTHHTILHQLASDDDQSTREDRQLAAECLLSVYTPHDSDELLLAFERAGFFRILRSWHRQEHRWGPLISTYLSDPDVPADEVFTSVDSALAVALRTKGDASSAVSATVADLLPSFLQVGLAQTAHLLDKHLPALHAQALEICCNERQRQFYYLRHLIQPSLVEESDENTPSIPSKSPSLSLTPASRALYLDLLCQYDPTGVVAALDSLPTDYFDLEEVVSICDDAQAYDAVIWALDRRGDIPSMFDKIDLVNHTQALKLAHAIADHVDETDSTDVDSLLGQLGTLAHMGTKICRQHSSQNTSTLAFPADEMWFRLLHSQIRTVQAVSGGLGVSLDLGNSSLERLRLLVQDTFTSLVQQSSSQDLSFPRLFKRLLDASSSGEFAQKTLYTEFRLILGGMLDSYRAEGDLLVITNRLVERDLFETIQEYTLERQKGRRMQLSS